MTEFNGYKLKPVDYKFKVGDIVECISTESRFKHVYGSHFTVTKVMPNHSGVDTHLKVSPEIANTSTPKANRFKLVKSANNEQHPEIRVGDLVKVNIEDGEILTVISISPVGNYFCSDKREYSASSLQIVKYQPKSNLDNQTPKQYKNNTNQQMEKQMPNFNLTLLIQFLAAQAAAKVDATNAKHIGILAESDGTYTGYVYANTLKELQDIVRKPENEGKKLYIFDYNQTIAQKPRPVTQVSRV